MITPSPWINYQNYIRTLRKIPIENLNLQRGIKYDLCDNCDIRLVLFDMLFVHWNNRKEYEKLSFLSGYYTGENQNK